QPQPRYCGSPISKARGGQSGADNGDSNSDQAANLALPTSGKVGVPENREKIQEIFGSSYENIEILPKNSNFGLELRKRTGKKQEKVISWRKSLRCYQLEAISSELSEISRKRTGKEQERQRFLQIPGSGSFGGGSGRPVPAVCGCWLKGCRPQRRGRGCAHPRHNKNRKNWTRLIRSSSI